MKVKTDRKKSEETIIKGFQEYDRVRQYLERIYLYGCFSREDFAAMNNGSAKNYDRVMHLINELFQEDDSSYIEGRKYRRFRRQYEDSGQNRMTDSYMLHGMDVQTYLLEYLRILAVLGKGARNVADMSIELEQLPYHDRKMYQNTRNRLNELESFGYLERMEQNSYGLRKDKMTDEQLKQLYDFVCFASGITYPRVPGSFLRRTLEREMYRRGIDVPQTVPFIFRHNTSHNVFDEEMVFQLLDVIRQRQWIRIEGTNYLPVQLRPECRMGRWYLVVVKRRKNKFTPAIRQLSKVKKLELTGELADEQTWLRAAEVVSAVYGDSLYSGKIASEPTLVEAKLEFGNARGLQNQFIREIRIGEIVREGSCSYYRAYINDPVELMPLLRSFSPWLRILPGEHDLDCRLHESLREMRDALEGDIQDQSPEKATIMAEKAEDDSSSSKSRLKLLNRFQSRLMQFSLELLARLGYEYSAPMTLESIRGMGRKYGVFHVDPILQLLEDAEFLQKTEDGYRIFRAGGRTVPCLPFSQAEREYLQYILTLPEAKLFLSEQNLQALKDEPPIWLAYIHRRKPKGMTIPRNPGPEGFRTLLEAIRTRRMVYYSFRTKDTVKEQETCCLPWKLEYSAYDCRWWVIFYDPDDPMGPRTIKATLNNLRNVRLGDRTQIAQEQIMAALEKRRIPEPVVIRVKDGHNALQRCFLAFENQEIRDSRRLSDQEYRLSFSAYAFDREEILRKLMHLGPKVILEGPEDLKQELQLRVSRALEINMDRS